MSSLHITQKTILSGVALLGAALAPLQSEAAYVLFDDFQGSGGFSTVTVGDVNTLTPYYTPNNPAITGGQAAISNSDLSLDGTLSIGATGYLATSNIANTYPTEHRHLFSLHYGDQGNTLFTFDYSNHPVNQLRLAFDDITTQTETLLNYHVTSSSGAPVTGSITLESGSDQYYFIDLDPTTTDITSISLSFSAFNASGITQTYSVALTELALVPEPTRALLGLAGLGFFFMQRRRK